MIFEDLNFEHFTNALTKTTCAKPLNLLHLMAQIISNNQLICFTFDSSLKNDKLYALRK